MNDNLVYTEKKFYCAAPSHINLDKVMYTNTYPLFLKLMNCREKGERLSEAIYDAFLAANLPVHDFWNAPSPVLSASFSFRKNICYSFLVNRIKEIYLNGERSLLKEYDGVCHVEVSYCGFLYSFLTDFHANKEVVVLTDFYKKVDRKNENLLLTSINGTSFVDNNEPIHYVRTKHNTIIINTFNAFCNYAHYLNRPCEKDFNKILFHDFMFTHSVTFGIPMRNNKIPGDRFNYIIFDNVVIIFDFIINFSENEQKIINEINDSFSEDDGSDAMQELIDSYAFADEGIFPSSDYNDWI